MYISQTVAGYLGESGANFDVVPHRHTHNALATARRACIPAAALAKAVMLTTRNQFVLALVPASRRVDPAAVGMLLRDRAPALADEEDLKYVFRDCEHGAVPATGPAFGVPTIIDDALLAASDVYFEAGDHEHLIHMKGGEFARMLTGQPHGHISTAVTA